MNYTTCFGKNNKKIIITIGDPAGIGVEIILKALKNIINLKKYDYSNFVVVGSYDIFEFFNKKFLVFNKNDFNKINFINSYDFNFRNYKIGKPSIESAHLAYYSLKESVRLINENKANALVTAPISKETFYLAGYKYSGHTEILQELCNSFKVEMCFYGKYFCLILVTRHMALKDAINVLTKELIFKSIVNGINFMKVLYPKSKISVIIPGLNPHASESNLFGNEEEKIITPAIRNINDLYKKEISNNKLKIVGPVPADTAFYFAYKNKKEKKIIISLYHDQGLIPFKLLHFETGVNITLGLPFIRTSPDHGTAYEIAGLNIANPNSMINSILLAFKLKPFSIV